jgi:phosphatidylglycerophosphate synthase
MLSGIHLIPAYLIIAREIFISGLREYAPSDDNKKAIPVSNLGKYKTAAQMSGLFLILLADVYSSLLLINNFGIALLWIAMIASIYSGYQYYRNIF